jgi:hypothetical protein
MIDRGMHARSAVESSRFRAVHLRERTVLVGYRVAAAKKALLFRIAGVGLDLPDLEDVPLLVG